VLFHHIIFTPGTIALVMVQYTRAVAFVNLETTELLLFRKLLTPIMKTNQ
jgi:hypothetical protein